MSKLYAFLHPEMPEQKKIFFPRFKGEDGEVVPFIIKPITSAENKALIKKHTIVTKDRGGTKSRLDSAAYQTALVIAGTVQPDFTDAELCEGYGVLDPYQVVGKMLLVGEYSKLADEILKLSGLDEESDEEAAEEAKN